MKVDFLSLKKVTSKYAEEIHEAVSRVVDSGWYLQGEENKRFEANYAAYIGTKYAVGCGNGLDALIWIFRAYMEMGLMKPGDEVIVSANTYIASILAITHNKLVPVFIEPDLLAELVRSLGNYGSSKKYVFEYKGFNSRLDEIQLPTINDWDAHVFHLFPVLCKRRDELQRYLTEKGIQTNIHYLIPPHKQKCYAEFNHLKFPLTEQIHEEELSLPISSVLELDEMEYVVKIVNGWK